MVDKDPYSAIIQTRLFRPKVVPDFVPRSGLYSHLDKGADCRLTLVCAPAGYGKSQLVSNWLESSDKLFCWISLDEEMSDYTVFVSYLIFSIRKLFPEACTRSRKLTSSSEKLSSQEISTTLLHEINEIDSPFVLVLDDYGFIHDQDIHDLLIQLYKFAPQTLQLVVLSRRDPPFSLNSLRAKAELNEIRQSNLKFTLAETTAFLRQTAPFSLSTQAELFLHEKFEGWPAGLRFIVLSLQDRDTIDDFLRDLKADSRHLHEYLVAEVLSCQPSPVREGLLKTSLLRRFCAPLYEKLCHSSLEKEDEGRQFIKRLQESNLFCVALDDRQEWFRYHHLFQDILQQSLYRRYESIEIEEIHQRASAWYEEQGFLEDALYHALQLPNFTVAVEFIMRNRQTLMNREEWHVLSKWLAHLSTEHIENNPELLVTKAWICEHQKRIPDMMKYLGQAENLLLAEQLKQTKIRQLRGEIDTMKSGYYYLNGNSNAALEHVKQAINDLSPDNSSGLAYAFLVESLSYQMTGDVEKAQKVIYDALQEVDRHTSTYHARLLLTLCMLDWLEGNLDAARIKAEHLLQFGRREKLQESSAFGYYFIGITSYYLNELKIAEKNLLAAAEEGITADWNTYTHGSFALALTYFYSGEQKKAGEVVESFIERALKANNISRLQLGQVFQVELNLRSGNLKAAHHWTRSEKFDQLHQVLRFFSPHITRVKLLLAQGAEENRDQLLRLLPEMEDFYRSIHNSRCLIEVLIIQAMFHESIGNTGEADTKLTEALTLAEPGGHFRLFLDHGREMHALLQRLDIESPLADYLHQLKNGFVETTPVNAAEHIAAAPADHFATPLTNREQEILELFANRLSNQEIAERLFIADNTVKRHATNIFRKLNVRNRRQAVAKAHQLGFIS